MDTLQASGASLAGGSQVRTPPNLVTLGAPEPIPSPDIMELEPEEPPQEPVEPAQVRRAGGGEGTVGKRSWVWEHFE